MKQSSDAFVVVQPTYLHGSFVLSCEHATRIVPTPLCATSEDEAWLAQHWGWDIGIEDVTLYLVESMHSVGLFSRFSRLVCDPNRDHEQESWIVEEVEGYALSFNKGLTSEERLRRKQMYHDPYHQALQELVQTRRQQAGDFTLMAMHSFTPVYKGQTRELEIGVLFDEVYADEARHLADAIADEGFRVECNEPYSGMQGMIYAAHRHGTEQNVRYMELEIRQDLIDTPSKAQALAARLQKALQRWAKGQT